MNQSIKDILEKINKLNRQLSEKYNQLAEKYGFSSAGRRIVFLQEFRKRNKKFKIPTWKYVIPQNIRHLLSMPFIYMMIVPVVILDIFVTIYHLVAFSLYHIPKIHCLYCTYVNGIFAYAVEVGARTERYWCPVKAAHKPKFHHDWYSEFADYGNPEEWKEKFNDEQCFIAPVDKI